MSPILCACNLCGWTVADPEEHVSWLNQFRGLYSSPAEGVVLTGVGLYDDLERGSYIAPPDQDARWNDPGYDRPESDEFGADRRAEHERYGFIFHASCWSVLEAAVHPSSVSHTRLYEICLSLPRPNETPCISWGHEYGGLMSRDDEHFFPWEDRETTQSFPEPISIYGSDVDEDGEDGSGLGVPSFDRLPLPDDDKGSKPVQPRVPLAALESDPYDVAEIQFLLRQNAEPPPEAGSPGLQIPAQDSFFKLPEEIRSRVATFLPTIDALSARKSSKAFWFVFDSQQFWKSRFSAEGERSWLFEASRLNGPQNWRWFYHRTNQTYLRSSPALQNRKRVWESSKGVSEVLRLGCYSNIPASPEARNIEWIKASGHVRPMPEDAPQLNFFEGCHVLHSNRLHLGDVGVLLQIGFSFVNIGDAEFLTGIRLIPVSGEPIQLGYQAESERFVSLSRLRGFNLAIGARGVHAIQCLSDDYDFDWCGNPSNSPLTRRIGIRDPIVALEVGLDGCKIVSISIAVNCPQKSTAPCHERKSSLLDSGIWFPSIPDSRLCLNEASFPQHKFHVVEYRPLIWTHFGGPGGVYLQNLTAVAVHVGGDTCPGIEFSYNNPDVPNECRTLGRHKCDKEAPGCETPWEFAIDGPDGERINGIEVHLAFLEGEEEEDVFEIYWQGAMESFKIFTNRGRSFHFAEERGSYSNGERWTRRVERINAAPRTTITGFYARPYTESFNYGLSALNVISEAI